jgi:hypothetical protein
MDALRQRWGWNESTAQRMIAEAGWVSNRSDLGSSSSVAG